MNLKFLLMCFMITVPVKIKTQSNDGEESKASATHRKPKCYAVTKSKIKISLYTNSKLSEGQQIPLFDERTLRKSNYDPQNPTRFIIHGKISRHTALISTSIRTEYLRRGNYNIFFVNWEYFTKHSYSKAKNRVPYVGEKVAEFIDFLNETVGMSFETLYVIGFSLGAHIAGYAGKFVQNGRINTIYGLDPSASLFSMKNPEQRLSSSDAEYVETIHTNAGELGILGPIGTVSFFVNGGRKQPGCAKAICSHLRSVKLFIESISDNNQLYSFKCESFEDIQKNTCKEVSNVTIGGEPSNTEKPEGIYFTPTNSKIPFGMGELLENDNDKLELIINTSNCSQS